MGQPLNSLINGIMGIDLLSLMTHGDFCRMYIQIIYHVGDFPVSSIM